MIILFTLLFFIFRELKVNVEKNGPLNGCGTYNHPYVITDGDPLTVAAKFISSGATSDMQKIRLPITEVDGIANNAKGNRWCNNLLGCAEFELATSGANSGKYVYSYFDKTESTVTNEETAGESDTDSVIETYTVDTENNTITVVADAGKDLSKTYLNIHTDEILTRLKADSNTDKMVTVYGKISMTFNPELLYDEFPQKNAGDVGIGVNVASTSNLAYQTDRLSHTSMTQPFETSGYYYYIESVNSAKIKYFAVDELDQYDEYGRTSQNESRLGPNGNSSDLEWMPIDTELDYNLTSIETSNLTSAQKVKLTMTVSKKEDKTSVVDGVTKVVGAEYKQVDNISDYLKVDSFKSGNNTVNKIAADSTVGEYVYEINKSNCNQKLGLNIFDFDVALSVKTGRNFTEYANYRVTIQAELLKENGDVVENTRVKDYIVYTNAKIHPEVITQNDLGA